jgi:hypothetical protein
LNVGLRTSDVGRRSGDGKLGLWGGEENHGWTPMDADGWGFGDDGRQS